MFDKMLSNCRMPKGFIGRIFVSIMNSGHVIISQWGLQHIKDEKVESILDIGCGGGANLARMLTMFPEGQVHGLDYSKDSVLVSRKKNKKELGKRCHIEQGSVSELPYEANVFSVVTAFETVYFWPDIANDFKQVYRSLQPKGKFLICNEAHDPTNTTFSDKVEGMRVYSQEELEQLLKISGFTAIEKDQNERGWICIVGQKL